jgi:ABC-type transport system involved in Fe-S cluster assembly fused permease/ATPase subunit
MSAQCSILNAIRRSYMSSEKQIKAARQNIRKAANAAKEKRTIAHLPKATRTALGKQGAKVAKEKRSHKAA